MIKYSLRCRDGHRFESWFADADAYDALARAGHLSCAVCGVAKVEKSVMAPRIGTGATTSAGPEARIAPEGKSRPLATPSTPQEKALAELRSKVERESEYVGGEFARVARAIHEGDEPHRSVHGEAKLAEAKALLEDGVPIMPLPFASPRKTN
ncbi:DUF1178 family protein [Oceanicola sp. 502str15]|uniref:DUF1178 family protein n=1 Tax=Oceanicola sp. 502str15 TaxID=2696061 RepID=UPI002096127B|nr:DUF1178 family protein [Oceanicola sp. 502str15]MCO6381353.1 DUF1178 family protein [Oceanicola sp. 502str15]